MNIQLKYLALIVLVSAILGATITRQYATREVIKTQVVEKVVTVDHDVIKDHNVIVTKEIINKDGSKEIDTTRTDDKNEDDDKTITNDKKTKIVDTKAPAEKQWFLSVEAGIDAQDGLSGLGAPTYGVTVNRRVLGPLYLGAWGNTKKEIGLSLGMEF